MRAFIVILSFIEVRVYHDGAQVLSEPTFDLGQSTLLGAICGSQFHILLIFCNKYFSVALCHLWWCLLIAQPSHPFFFYCTDILHRGSSDIGTLNEIIAKYQNHWKVSTVIPSQKKPLVIMSQFDLIQSKTFALGLNILQKKEQTNQATAWKVYHSTQRDHKNCIRKAKQAEKK